MAEVFTEVVIAPSFTARRARGVRRAPQPPRRGGPALTGSGLDVRPLPGGALVQDRDLATETRARGQAASLRRLDGGLEPRPPTDAEWADLVLAWTIAWRVKSNTIVLVKDGATVGVGAGQMSRVDSSWIAVRKAGERANGAVVASDAFFPFPDALEVAARGRLHGGGPPRRIEGRRRRARRRRGGQGWPSS